MARTQEEPAPEPRWSAADTLCLLGITLAGGLLRLYRVADPKSFVFDEVYYAKDACYYVHASIEKCRLDDFQNEVHPPLGKWMISAGIRLFGFDSLGWRIATVLGGTITLILLYLLARRLLGSTIGATVSTGLLAIDPLHLVQSRTSMIDVFVPMFAVAAFLFVVLDRDRLLRRGLHEDEEKGVAIRGRPWRLAAGIAGGAALASKWTGAFVLPATIILTVAWEVGARRAAGWGTAIRGFMRREALTVALWLILVPAVVYVATYAGRGIEGEVLAAPWSDGSWWRGFWDEQIANLSFHQGLESSHPYQSPAWSWILLKRPVSYFFETNSADEYQEILATGSPFVWWTSIAALGFAMVTWVRRRGAGRPEGLILAGFLFSYVPWLMIAGGRSAVFLFYFVATVPFLCLALGYVATRLGRSWEARSAIALFSVVAVIYFAFLYPLLTKRPLSQPDWDKRLLFFKDCDKPPGEIKTTTVTETINGKPTSSASESNTNEDLPPEGWCWI